jgi:hypothetical protein
VRDQKTTGPPGPGRAWVLGIFLATLAPYFLVAPHVLANLEPPTGDQPHYLMTVISIVDDWDFDELNNYNSAASFRQFQPVSYPLDFEGLRMPFPLVPGGHSIPAANRPRNEWYSVHGPGVPLVAVPGWVLGNQLAPLLNTLTAHGGGGWPGVVFWFSVLGALLAVQVFLLAWDTTGSRTVALVTWAALAFSNPQMTHSFLIFPEIPAALLILYSFRRLNFGWRNNNAWHLAISGLCLGCLPWLHRRFVPVVACLIALAIYNWWRARQPNSGRATVTDEEPSGLSNVARLGLVLSPILLLGALLVSHNLWLHGTALATQPNDLFWIPGHDKNGVSALSDWPLLLLSALGLLLDQQWGLLIYAPVFALAIVGAAAMWRQPTQRVTVSWLALVLVPYFLVIANYREWWGGWSPPGRYLAAVSPLLAAPLARSLFDLRGSTPYKWLYASLSACGIAMMAALLAGLDNRAPGQPPAFFNLPTGQASLFIWLNHHIHVDLIGLLPALSPWFSNRQAPPPWLQLASLVGLFGGTALAGLQLLATCTSQPKPASGRPPSVRRTLLSTTALFDYLSRHRETVACAAVALAISSVVVIATISAFAWNPSVLVRMSGTEPLAAVARSTDPSFVFVEPGAHYDGVYFYAIARDPFALGPEHTRIDHSTYHYGHAAYGWLAWLLSGGQPGLVPAT